MRQSRSILALLLAAACAVGADAHARGADPASPQPARNLLPNRAERLRIGLSHGSREFVITTPDAVESDAKLVMTDATGAESLQAGHKLRARLIVRTDRPDLVDAALAAAGYANRTRRVSDRAGPLREFHLAELPSIRAAAAVAEALRADARIGEVSLDTTRPRVLREAPTDPNFANQWYLVNVTTPAASTNVLPAWNAGFTGTGVTVGIVEDGFYAAHPDIAPNYNALASQAPNWSPGYLDHGTSTAGLVASVANNGEGGAGVAFGAKVSQQFIGSDTETQTAFQFRNDLNFVKSNSWGPWDNANIAFISSLEQAGLDDAVINGRAGKGVVFTWAAGNGGQNSDRVDYDPYASNRCVISVGSIDNIDRRAVYSEPGSSLMVVTTSSYDFGGSNGSGVFAPTGQAGYNFAFGGTSAASPIAAGVVALILQANPNLTWRDVQHVLIRSARKANPLDPGWTQNGAHSVPGGGRWINYDYGFGAIDAAAAVTLAQTFPLRTPELSVASPQVFPSLNLPDPNPGTTTVTSTVVVPSHLLLEHVQLIITAQHPRVGDLRVELVSPAGTVSLVADTRFDAPLFGYNAYTFSTVRCWDELARGTWTLRVTDRAVGSTGTLNSWRVKLFGTTPPCPADWDRNGTVSIDDLFIFINDWMSGLGDFGNSGATDVDDLFLYINEWLSSGGSCP